MKKRFPMIVILILLAASAFLGVEIFYRQMEQKYSFIRTAVKEMVPSILSSPPSPMTGPVEEQATPAVPAVPETQERTQPEKTHAIQQLDQIVMRYRLRGTMAGDRTRGQAIIEDTATKMTRIYRVNTKIENAIIKEILWDKIVLTLDGQEAALTMEGATGGLPVAGNAGKKPFGAGPAGSDKQHIVLDPATIDQVFKNIGQSQSQVAIQPYLEKGKPAGVKLSGDPTGSLTAETGIRSGDVIISVNGQAIKSMNDAMRIYENLKASGAKSAAVQILRNGKLITIHYSVP